MFKIADDASPDFDLAEDEIEAIKSAVQETANKSASAVSAESHEDSRTWRDSRDGAEWNIYLDLLSDEEYEEMNEKG